VVLSAVLLFIKVTDLNMVLNDISFTFMVTRKLLRFEAQIRLECNNGIFVLVETNYYQESAEINISCPDIYLFVYLGNINLFGAI